MEHEGSGHSFHIHRVVTGEAMCSFAKPDWPGDHCSEPMPTGTLAVVRAVLEYFNGL